MQCNVRENILFRPQSSHSQSSDVMISKKKINPFCFLAPSIILYRQSVRYI